MSSFSDFYRWLLLGRQNPRTENIEHQEHDMFAAGKKGLKAALKTSKKGAKNASKQALETAKRKLNNKAPNKTTTADTVASPDEEVLVIEAAEAHVEVVIEPEEPSTIGGRRGRFEVFEAQTDAHNEFDKEEEERSGFDIGPSAEELEDLVLTAPDDEAICEDEDVADEGDVADAEDEDDFTAVERDDVERSDERE